MPSISPYSVRMRENADEKNFNYGQFWRSVTNQKLEDVYQFFTGFQDIFTFFPIIFDEPFCINCFREKFHRRCLAGSYIYL